MGKNPEGRAERRRLWILVEPLLVVGMLVVLGFFVWVLATSPREALCPQAADLAQARLLDRAQEIYADPDADEDDCKGGLEAVEATQAEAAKKFEQARIYGAIGLPEPEPTEPPPAPVTTSPGTAETAKTEAQKEAEKEAAKKPATAAEHAKAKAEKAAVEREEAVAAAIDAYADGLELSPFETAARLGLAALVKELGPAEGEAVAARCEVARSLAAAGLLEEAGPVISSVPFSARAECEEALAEVQARRAAAAASLREAKRLEAKGETDRAREKFAMALLANVGLGDARTGLEESIEEGSCLDAVGDWLAGVPGTLETALSWLLPLVAILLIGGLLLMLAAWIGVRELSARYLAVRKRADRWRDRPVLSFLYNAAVPQFSIDELGGSESAAVKGKDFSAMLEAAVAKQQGREPAFPFDRVNKDRAAKFDLTELTGLLAAGPQTKLLGSVVQLLSKLFRRRTVHVGGSLGPLTRQGASVVLVLEGNGRDVGAEVTLREQDFAPKPGGEGVDRWLQLLPAAAAWTRWQLAAAHALPAKIGESHWLADARFQTALAWQGAEDFPRAEELYASTIELDPTMLPAAHNLAVLEIRAGRYELAATLILWLRERLASASAEAREPWPTLETGSLYTLALARAYPAIVGAAAAPEKDRREARGHAKVLVETLVRELMKPTLDSTLRAELERAEAPSVALLASLMVEADESLRDEAATRVEENAGPGQPLSRSDLTSGVGNRKPWELIDGYVLRGGGGLSRRSSYNLACYYTRLLLDGDGKARPGCARKAYAALEAALVGGGLVAWAKKDPSLAPLQAADRVKFDGLVAGFKLKPLAAETKAPTQ